MDVFILAIEHGSIIQDDVEIKAQPGSSPESRKYLFM